MEIVSLVISVLAVFVAVGNFLYTQARMDQRESVKWRRETLTKATSEFIEASETRNQLLSLNPNDWLKDHNDQQIALISKMKMCRNQFWVIGAEELYEQAGVIMEMHVFGANGASLHASKADPTSAIVDIKNLNIENSKLIILTRRYLNSKQIKKSISKISRDDRQPDRRTC